MSVAAQYPGTCPVCEHNIEVGELITDLGGGVWIHVECPAVET